MAAMLGHPMAMGHRWLMVKGMALAMRGNLPTMPDDDGWRLLRAGDYAGAQSAATELLARSDATDPDWEPDDLRQRAHTLLGFIALGRGDLDEAETELRLSAEVAETPVLGSFGPDLGLLWELLRCGRSEGAIYFAQRFAEFWSGPGVRSLDVKTGDL
jgi:hypothetical protein